MEYVGKGWWGMQLDGGDAVLSAQVAEVGEAAAAWQVGKRIGFAVDVPETAEAGSVSGRWAVCCFEFAVNELHFVFVSAVVVEHRERGA